MPLTLKSIARISWSWLISWPDASGDRCLLCGNARREHDSKIHRFEERDYAR